MKYANKLFTFLADAWLSGDITWGFGTRESAVRSNTINDVRIHLVREGISYVEVVLNKKYVGKNTRREVIGRALTQERALEIAKERYARGIEDSRLEDSYTDHKETFEWDVQVGEKVLSNDIEFITRDIDCTGIEECLEESVAKHHARREREEAEKND